MPPELAVITVDYMKSRDGDWKPAYCTDCPHAYLKDKAKKSVATCRLTGQPLQGRLPYLMPHCRVEDWLKALIDFNQYKAVNEAFLVKKWIVRYIKFVRSIEGFLKELKAQSTKPDKSLLAMLESAYREWHDE